MPRKELLVIWNKKQFFTKAIYTFDAKVGSGTRAGSGSITLKSCSLILNRKVWIHNQCGGSVFFLQDLDPGFKFAASRSRIWNPDPYPPTPPIPGWVLCPPFPAILYINIIQQFGWFICTYTPTRHFLILHNTGGFTTCPLSRASIHTYYGKLAVVRLAGGSPTPPPSMPRSYSTPLPLSGSLGSGSVIWKK